MYALFVQHMPDNRRELVNRSTLTGTLANDLTCKEWYLYRQDSSHGAWVEVWKCEREGQLEGVSNEVEQRPCCLALIRRD